MGRIRNLELANILVQHVADLAIHPMQEEKVEMK